MKFSAADRFLNACLMNFTEELNATYGIMQHCGLELNSSLCAGISGHSVQNIFKNEVNKLDFATEPKVKMCLNLWSNINSYFTSCICSCTEPETLLITWSPSCMFHQIRQEPPCQMNYVILIPTSQTGSLNSFESGLWRRHPCLVSLLWKRRLS